MQNLLTSSSLEAQLRNANPWRRGERLFGVPPIRRWAFEVLLRGIERPLAPVTVLRGPRQIGKTTLVTQLVEDLLAKGVDPRRIFLGCSSTICRSCAGCRNRYLTLRNGTLVFKVWHCVVRHVIHDTVEAGRLKLAASHSV